MKYGGRFKKIFLGFFLPLVWVSGMVVLPLLLPALDRCFFGWPRMENPALKTSGLFLILFGLAIFLYCSRLFLKFGQGTSSPTLPPKKFVAQGLYKFTRNPMYLGYFTVFFGYFLFFGVISLLFYFLLAMVFFNFYVILVEEPELKQRFGREYLGYLKKVPRWLK